MSLLLRKLPERAVVSGRRRQSATAEFQSTAPHRGLALLLLVIPLTLYGSQIGRWGIDRDEVYTLIDSSLPISQLLEWETKPIYYLLCHALLWLELPWPTEVVLRLPSALGSALIPLATYLGLRMGGRHEKQAILTALLFGSSPWMLSFAVTARFYGLVTLLVILAIAALLRWQTFRQLRWLAAFVIMCLLATATHTTVATLLPAGLLVVLLTAFWENPDLTRRWLRRWACVGGCVAMLLTGVAWWILSDQLTFWLNAQPHQFGNYTLFQLLLALLVNVGIPIWGLASLALLKPLSAWEPMERLLGILVVGSLVPLLLMVPLGGGVAPHYLLAGVVPLFVLAGRHWSQIDDRLGSLRQRLAIGCGILACCIPSLASTLRNGDHFDYRQAAAFVESILCEDTILVSSGHLNLALFLPDREISELGTFERGVPRELLDEVIQQAEVQDRPLLIVSRETRLRLSMDDQDWFYGRFALLRDFETLRYDHRRHRVAVYQYRPSPRLSRSTQLTSLEVTSTPVPSVREPQLIPNTLGVR